MPRNRYGLTHTSARLSPNENSYPICRCDTLAACKSMRGVYRRNPNCQSPLSGSRGASSVGPANVLVPSAGDGGTEKAIRYAWRTGFFPPSVVPHDFKHIALHPLGTHDVKSLWKFRNRRGRSNSRPPTPQCRHATSSRRVVYSACTKGARVGTADAGVRRFSVLAAYSSPRVREVDRQTARSILKQGSRSVTDTM